MFQAFFNILILQWWLELTRKTPRITGICETFNYTVNVEPHAYCCLGLDDSGRKTVVWEGRRTKWEITRKLIIHPP